MQTRADRLTPLPENVLSIAVARRSWNGLAVVVSECRGAGRVVHSLCHETETRLTVLLDESGGRCEPRLRADRPCPIDYTPRHMHFAPAGLEIWGYCADYRFTRDATLSFDLAALDARLGEGVDCASLATPRLRFSDDRIWTLARMLAGAVNDPDPSAQLFGDGLTAGVVALMAARPPRAEVHGLAPWQLRRVRDHMEAHLPERIELAQLAALAGLSQSHFSRAFKASTGVAPYRWQLEARIRRAEALLLETRASLDQVATATGFADAVHLGRTFRRLTGATPAAWRRDRKS